MNKITLPALFVLLLVGCASTASDSHKTVLDSQFWNSAIVITRPGEMGLLNIIPCTVSFSNDQELRLLGEQRAVAVVAPGRYTFVAHSVDGNDPYKSTDRFAWVSNKVEVELKPAQIVYFVLTDVEHTAWKLTQESERRQGRP